LENKPNPLPEWNMRGGYEFEVEERQQLRQWIDRLGETARSTVEIVSSRQGWGNLKIGRSIIGEPLCLAGKKFDWGFGTHADSEIVLRATAPLKTFRAKVGIDLNCSSSETPIKARFEVIVDGQCRWSSPELRVTDEPVAAEVALDGATELTLRAFADEPLRFGHVDWAAAEVITVDGEVVRLGDPAVTSDKVLPISFRVGGIDSEIWFRRWGIVHTVEAGLHRYSCCDRETGLECRLELQEYDTMAACLWRLSFHNAGSKATPILNQVRSLDLSWPSSSRKALYRARGSFHYTDDAKFQAESFRDDFMMVCDNLKTPVQMGGVGGRPSVDWMPYFNYQGADDGLMFGIGWTGQWQAEIASGALECVRFQAGIETFHAYLEPGETVELPSVLMIFRQGNDYWRGHNQLRHFIQEFLLPRIDGRTIQAPLCNLTWGGMVTDSHLARIANLKKERIPLDYYWIDAGWYGQAGPNMDEFSPQWGSQAGDWSINRDTFPQGFKPISDAVHATGMKFLLWCEPERAINGTPITREHPEWFLGGKNRDLLLNLGLPAARQWCTELIAGLIEDQGIDCYRQDFNISPLPLWQANDAPDRQGVTEVRYVAGLYAFLGELRCRFPHLLIDNCASGGRRLDFEMMRYSVPLWASDMQCFPDYLTERNQQLIHGLACWLPQFAFGTQDHVGDTYHFRSTMAAGINIHLFTYERCPIDPAYPYGWLRERLAEYHRAKVFFSGDFYPLTDQSQSAKDWTVYQFNRPDLNEAMLMAFRREDSPFAAAGLGLKNLDPAETYTIEDVDGQTTFSASGAALMSEGLAVEIGKKRDCRLYFLSRK